MSVLVTARTLPRRQCRIAASNDGVAWPNGSRCLMWTERKNDWAAENKRHQRHKLHLILEACQSGALPNVAVFHVKESRKIPIAYQNKTRYQYYFCWGCSRTSNITKFHLFLSTCKSRIFYFQILEFQPGLSRSSGRKHRNGKDQSNKA